MCTGARCAAKVNIRYAIAVAILGLLLFVDGVTLVVFGAIWDSITAGNSQLYVVKEKQGIYSYDDGWIENNVLMYEGLLVCIPAIPAFLLLCKRVRSTSILFLLSLLMALIGSILAAVFGGVSWTNIQIVYQSYKDDFCERDDTQCTCKLPKGWANERTATMFFSNCHEIQTLHNIINVYFALAIVACLLTTIGTYLGCVGCCNPEEDPHKETTRLVSSEPPCYSSVYNNPASQQGAGFNNQGMMPNRGYISAVPEAPMGPPGAMAPGAPPQAGAMAPEPNNMPGQPRSGKAAMSSQQFGAGAWMGGEEEPLVRY